MSLGKLFNGYAITPILATAFDATIRGITAQWALVRDRDKKSFTVTERKDRRERQKPGEPHRFVMECSCGQWGACDEIRAVQSFRPMPDSPPPVAIARLREVA